MRPVAAIGGAIHDVARLKAMDLEPCYIIAVSEPTLNIIQNYAIDEIAYLSRYGVEFDGAYYTPVSETDPDYDFVLDTIRRYRLEVNDLTCDLVEAIEKLTEAVANAACKNVSQDIDSPPNDGTVTVGGPDDQFFTQEEYLDAKCSVSNAIYDTILEFTEKLGEDIDTIKLGFGITSGILAVAAIAGPVSWAIFGVGAALAAVAYHILSYSLDYADMASALDDVHEDVVNALYDAGDTGSAKADFLTALATSTPALTSAETAYIKMLLTNNMLNLLFDPRPDVAVYVSPDPVVCTGGCAELITIDPGTVTSGTANTSGTPFTVTSAATSPFNIKLEITQGGCPCEDYEIEIISWEYLDTGPGSKITNCDGVDVWRYNIHGYGTLIGTHIARYIYTAGSQQNELELAITAL